MSELLETCETCGKEKSATYVPFGVGVLGAALCPKCQKIAKNPSFKTELAHILSTGNGDLDKFFKSNQVIVPICNKCGEDLRASNWAPSDQARNRHVCMECKNKKMLERRNKLKMVTTPEKQAKKPASADITKFCTLHNLGGIPVPMESTSQKDGVVNGS